MKLLVGVGNPGDLYKKTRHNLGKIFLEKLAKEKTLQWQQKQKLKCSLAYSHQFILCQPSVFMNLSGETVLLVKNYYQIPLENIIIIHDDLDLKFLTIKLKFGGGNAGHKGLKSIDSSLKSNNYFRLRLGIDRPTNSTIEKYVVSKFTTEQLSKIEQKFSLLEGLIELFINNHVKLFQDQLSKLNQELNIL